MNLVLWFVSVHLSSSSVNKQWGLLPAFTDPVFHKILHESAPLHTCPRPAYFAKNYFNIILQSKPRSAYIVLFN
jgi:hypothetical protein